MLGLNTHEPSISTINSRLPGFGGRSFEDGWPDLALSKSILKGMKGSQLGLSARIWEKSWKKWVTVDVTLNHPINLFSSPRHSEHFGQTPCSAVGSEVMSFAVR